MRNPSVSDASKIFESKINVAGGEFPISLHVLESFTGRQDVALKINGKIVSVGEVDFKRGGRVIYTGKHTGSILLTDSIKNYVKDNSPEVNDI